VQHYDAADGTTVGRIGAEGEYYWGRFTLRGIAGIEGGDEGRHVTASKITEFDMDTRFFDMIDLAYYVTDNFNVFAGHHYVGGN
ncbi:hypothetical protein J8J27_32455, partial [Mycobacterium tuberculosis]|nr:hypothetical protein [Mycobacterium tuberculosis]